MIDPILKYCQQPVVAPTDGRGHEKETDEKGGNDGVPLLLLLWSFFIPFLELDKEEHSKCQVFLTEASAKCVGREKCPVAFLSLVLGRIILVVVDDDGDPFAAVSGWMEPWAPLTDCCLVGATWQETGSKTFAGCCWLLLVWPFSYSISIHFYTHAEWEGKQALVSTPASLSRVYYSRKSPRQSCSSSSWLHTINKRRLLPHSNLARIKKSRNLIYCPWWHVILGLFHQKFRQVQKTLAPLLNWITNNSSISNIFWHSDSFGNRVKRSGN